jgi:hypothetical protein
MASSRAPNSAVHRSHVKQRGSRVKPEVATVSLAQGVFGGERRGRIGTEREQLNAGKFSKRLTRCASVHRYHACTWTRTYNSLNLSLNSFSSRPFRALNSNWYRTHFFLSFLAVQRSNVQMFFFSIHKFYYLHQNLTLIWVNWMFPSHLYMFFFFWKLTSARYIQPYQPYIVLQFCIQPYYNIKPRLKFWICILIKALSGSMYFLCVSW